MSLDGQKLRPYIPMAEARGFTGAVHNDYGDICEIKNAYIIVNHYASFYTQNKLPLKEGESLFIGSNEFDYSYAN